MVYSAVCISPPSCSSNISDITERMAAAREAGVRHVDFWASAKQPEWADVKLRVAGVHAHIAPTVSELCGVHLEPVTGCRVRDGGRMRAAVPAVIAICGSSHV